MAKRKLTTDDVASIVRLTREEVEPQRIYEQVAAISAETCGWVMLTALKFVESGDFVERLYSSDPVAYPVGGRKPLDKLGESHGSTGAGSVFLAGMKEDVRRAFFDHELIFSLGITAILNVPISYAGRRLGTLNLCGEEGTYGPDEVHAAEVLAGLLVPVLLRELDMGVDTP